MWFEVHLYFRIWDSPRIPVTDNGLTWATILGIALHVCNIMLEVCFSIEICIYIPGWAPTRNSICSPLATIWGASPIKQARIAKGYRIIRKSSKFIPKSLEFHNQNMKVDYIWDRPERGNKTECRLPGQKKRTKPVRIIRFMRRFHGRSGWGPLVGQLEYICVLARG